MQRRSYKSLRLAKTGNSSCNCRNESGELLVETLFTIVLVGTGVVAIVAALGIVIGWSTSDRSATKVEVALQSYAEEIAAASYQDSCGSEYSEIFPPGYDDTLITLAVSDTDYWNGTAFVAECSNDGFQKLTLSGTATDGSATRTLTIYKRLE